MQFLGRIVDEFAVRSHQTCIAKLIFQGLCRTLSGKVVLKMNYFNKHLAKIGLWGHAK